MHGAQRSLKSIAVSLADSRHVDTDSEHSHTHTTVSTHRGAVLCCAVTCLGPYGTGYQLFTHHLCMHANLQSRISCSVTATAKGRTGGGGGGEQEKGVGERRGEQWVAGGGGGGARENGIKIEGDGE